MTSRTERKRRRVAKLHAENPCCHWCGKETIIFLRHGGGAPPNAATLDHLNSRLNPNRKIPNTTNEQRTVLACHQCNFNRGKEEEANLPIEEKQKRASKGTGRFRHRPSLKYRYSSVLSERLSIELKPEHSEGSTELQQKEA